MALFYVVVLAFLSMFAWGVASAVLRAYRLGKTGTLTLVLVAAVLSAGWALSFGLAWHTWTMPQPGPDQGRYLTTLTLLGSVFMFGGAAVTALAWAVRTGQFDNFHRQARSIFDTDEPVGVPTDSFPAGRPGRGFGDNPVGGTDGDD